MRKLTAILLSLMLVLLAAGAFADTDITVTGTGTVLVPADTAIVSLGILARDRDVLKAQQQANETIAAIRAKLTENGIDAADINTGYLNIYAIYDYSGETETLTAYSATATLSIRLTDMTVVGKVIDLAFEAGANMLNGVEFSASDTSEAAAEALRQAVADARTKAEVLAEAAGLRITGIEVIAEGGTYSFDSGANNFRVSAKGTVTEEDSYSGETVVQSAKMQVTASITITFEAK